MEQNKKVLLHACCAVCSGYPISLLKEMGVHVVSKEIIPWRFDIARKTFNQRTSR